MADLHVRSLTPGDLPQVADLHLAAFPTSILSALGHDPVLRYYEWQLVGPHEITALGVWEGDQLSAFCIGGTFRGSLSGFLRKNRTRLLLRVLTHPWVIFHKAFHSRVKTALRLQRRKPQPPAETPVAGSHPKEDVRSFGILAIAVSPTRQGAGLGGRLMRECESVAREKGFGQMHLTVSPDNGQAVRFYERLGWERVEEKSVWNGKMRKLLPCTASKA